MTFGTIIHGTLRPQDLIPALLRELRSWSPDEASHVSSGIPHDDLVGETGMDIIDDHPWWASEDCAEVLAELFDALNGEGPADSYFGAHPGDGADFGFWPVDFLD